MNAAKRTPTSGVTSGAPRSLAWLERLVRTDSVNPALVQGAAGEGAMADLVAAWGEQRGLEVTRLEPQAGRPSVVLVARGSGGGASLMLDAHLDTVGVEGMDAPFEPRLEGGRLYGRGALDMKAGLAAAMSALEAAAAADLRGDVLLAAVADEEHASIGTEAVLERFGADAAIVTEPSNLELQLAHRGFAVFELETFGVASHTSQPERGVNAVTHMGRVLAGIERLQAALTERAPHPLTGHGVAQVVRIEGGEQLFVTPAGCRASYERRTLPGESRAQVEAEVQAVLQGAAQGAPGFRGHAELTLLREPFEVDSDALVVRLAEAHARRVLGREAVVAGAPYWTDAALLQAAGIPTLVLGPSGEGMHAADEHVELSSVAALEAILDGVIAEFCA